MNRTEANLQAAAHAISEAELQKSVMDLCAFLGILAFHSTDSRRDSCAGFPDLVLVGGRGTIFRELKAMRGHVRVEQQRWISRLLRSGQDAGVWKPTDWLDNTIARELAAIR